VPAFNIDPNNRTGSAISYGAGAGRGNPYKTKPVTRKITRPKAVVSSTTGSSGAARAGDRKAKTQWKQNPASLAYWMNRTKGQANAKNKAYALHKRALKAADAKGNINVLDVVKSKWGRKTYLGGM